MSKIHPADFQGRFRRARRTIGAALILLFLALPWIRVRGEPAILLDFWNRRFSILGLTFWSHEAPLIFFILAGAAITLGWLTSVFGRSWCGWACPQTVYMEVIFRRLERLIEGDAVRRRQLDAAPWDGRKISLKSVKWAAFLVVSLILSHGFLAYFIGKDRLLAMILEGPSAHTAPFLAMLVITASILFDFGYFREQLCTQLCPYGRLQSVLMDRNSLAIVYDSARGEPRAGGGDCVDCKRCVAVCPTGIDIRRGIQLECVACASCVDACDTVMSRLKKPKGLIRYGSESGARRPTPFRFRPMAYATILALILSALGWILHRRQDLETTIVRHVGAPYDIIENGRREVVNRFHLTLLNQSHDRIEISLPVAADNRADGIQTVSPTLPAQLGPGESRRVDLFVRFPVSALTLGHATLPLSIPARSLETGAESRPLGKFFQEVTLVGPLR